MGNIFGWYPFLEAGLVSGQYIIDMKMLA